MNSPSRGLGGVREGRREAGLNELTLKSGAPARKRRRPRSVLLGAKAAAAAAGGRVSEQVKFQGRSKDDVGWRRRKKRGDTSDSRFSVKSISISATSTREDEDEEWHRERQFLRVDVFRYYQR